MTILVHDDDDMNDNVFKDSVFETECATAALSNFESTDNSWGIHMFEFVDMSDFTLNNAVFDSISDSSTSSPVIRIVHLTTFALNDITVSNINTPSMATVVEIVCNNTGSILSMDLL